MCMMLHLLKCVVTTWAVKFSSLRHVSNFRKKVPIFFCTSSAKSGQQLKYSDFKGHQSTGKYLVSTCLVIGSTLAFFNKEREREEDRETTETYQNVLSVKEAISRSRELIEKQKIKVGAPGLSVCVSVNGRLTWKEGFGFADLENHVTCRPETVMRIASISKPIAMAIVAKIWEDGKLDLDKSVEQYVKKWPEKCFQGKPVTITTRYLASHLSGIRHYQKDCGKSRKTQHETESEKKETSKKDIIKSTENSTSKQAKQGHTEYELPEYHIMKTFASTSDALGLFASDELCSEPGTEYLYTTLGYTLLSAVVEGASGKDFKILSESLFKELGMAQTYLEQPLPIIPNRARFYRKTTSSGFIENTPYVDNSYKWAGGGYLSTVIDLVKFGNCMLYSYQFDTKFNTLPGFLKADTVKMLWSPVTKTNCTWDETGGKYGMGWGVMEEIKHHGLAQYRPFYVSHTGGAVGASSVLIIIPSAKKDIQKAPSGVVVSILTNLQGVSLHKVGYEIACLFQAATDTSFISYKTSEKKTVNENVPRQ